MLTTVVIVVVSGALILGAAWGIYGELPGAVQGFVVALGGGALIISAVLELIEPATEQTSIWSAFAWVLIGAVVFTAVDYVVDEVWGANSGGGLLVAITLDGIPENLALGVTLIGAGPLQVAALAGSIFLSNLPEAAGGAKEMAAEGRSKGTVLALWTATAAILSVAALAGNFFLAGVSQDLLALIRAFAGGAVVASLATEIFPKAYKENAHLAGIATSIGLIIALYLDHLA